jgi:hypothetical protein
MCVDLRKAALDQSRKASSISPQEICGHLSSLTAYAFTKQAAPGSSNNLHNLHFLRDEGNRTNWE